VQRVHWIDAFAQLQRLGRHLEKATVISVDTEQDAFFAYRPKVCLLQVGALDEEWIIDPLAVRDFSPIRDIFADPAIPKIMHAGENDISLMRRDCDLPVAGLFDTMAAASILGKPKTGLANLLDELFDIQIEKRYQRSDWRMRPLMNEQVEYAALDVRYLPQLRNHLMAGLTKLGRQDEAASEFSRIERVEWQPKEFDPDDYFRVSGAKRLDGVSRRVLRSLFVLRNEVAKSEDSAPFRVATEWALVSLAKNRPSSREELGRTRGLSADVLKTIGKDILEAVRDAEAAGPLPIPRRKRTNNGSPRLDDRQRRHFDDLRSWRMQRATDRGVEPGRVIPNALLEKVVRYMPKSRDELGRAGLEPWRIREYGDDILGVLESVK